MNLCMMGLMLAGSLFLGLTAQAQDVTEEYLDAIDHAIEAAETAQNERERQEAEENVTEFEQALQELAFSPQALPSSIRAVSVECNGECTDSTLGQLCAIAGAGLTPIAVDCGNVDNDGTGIACTGPGDNRCSVLTLSPAHSLSTYCDDDGGWDATVFCAQP